jgi:murein DD-endopeptidase MepM/ murein hydrolase activator NlpD
MKLTLSESDIRKVIANTLREAGFDRAQSGVSGGTTARASKKGDLEIFVPAGAQFIHPIVKNLDGNTPRLGSVPQEDREITVDGVTKTAHHRGYDVPMPEGYPIVSVAAGKVVLAKSGSPSAGNYIVIRHTNNLVASMQYTAYMHLSGFDITQGDSVAAGQLIGRSGNTGKSTGPHLHFQIGGKPDTREHSFEKIKYDTFFRGCKQASYSPSGKNRPEEEQTGREKRLARRQDRRDRRQDRRDARQSGEEEAEASSDSTSV